MKIEPQVTIPLHEYQRLMMLDSDVRRSKDRIKDIHDRFSREYPDYMTFGTWLEEVAKQARYFCQEMVPLGENSSSIALHRLSQIAFNAVEREYWPKEHWQAFEALLKDLNGESER